LVVKVRNDVLTVYPLVKERCIDVSQVTTILHASRASCRVFRTAPLLQSLAELGQPGGMQELIDTLLPLPSSHAADIREEAQTLHAAAS